MRLSMKFLKKDKWTSFWDSSMNKVCSRYLSSSSMGHSVAEDIMNNFLEASNEMKLCNLIQVSMDGPNVNWSFLEQLSSDLHDEYGTTILFRGSCGLHVINGSLTTGHKAANWKVQVQLKYFLNFLRIALQGGLITSILQDAISFEKSFVQ